MPKKGDAAVAEAPAAVPPFNFETAASSFNFEPWARTEGHLGSGRGAGGRGLGHGGARRHRRIYRDNIQGIKDEHCLAMAARAGVLQVSSHCFEEMRGIILEWLKNKLRSAITKAEHSRRKTVLANDVLSASIDDEGQGQNKLLCGTGRIADVYAAKFSATAAGNTSSFTDLAADYCTVETRKAIDQFYSSNDADDEDSNIEGCDEKGFEEAVSSAWLISDEEEEAYANYSRLPRPSGTAEDAVMPGSGHGRYPSGVMFKSEADLKARPMQPHIDSIKYIRRMQEHTGPVLPFLPFSRLVREVGQDYKTDLQFEPAALRVLQAMLEEYMNSLLHNANLAMLGRGGNQSCTFPFVGFSTKDRDAAVAARAACTDLPERSSLAIFPKDLLLTRQIWGERSSPFY